MSRRSDRRKKLRLIVNPKLAVASDVQNPATVLESLAAAAGSAQPLSQPLSQPESVECVSFMPMQDIRAVAANRFKSMQVSSQIAFLAAILILTCFWSALPVFSLLFLVLLAAALSRNKMLSKYQIVFSKSALKFHHDQFRSLSIDWGNVACVELSGKQEQKINIKLRKASLGRWQSWYFQDLVGPDNSIQILLSNMSEDARSRCLFELLENCPEEILHDLSSGESSGKPELEDRTADFKSPDFKSPDFSSPDFSSPDFSSPDLSSPDLLSMPYSAPEAYRKALSSFLQSKEKLIVFVLSFLSVCLIFWLGMLNCLPVLGILLGALSVLAFSVKDMEQRLNFDSDGIYFKYKFPAGSKSLVIAWQEISSVYSLKQRRIIGSYETAEFLLSPDKGKRFKLAVLSFLSGGLLKRRGSEFLLSVDLSLLASCDERRTLLSMVRKNLDAALIDKSFEEVLNPTDPASYTQLWLDSLTGNQDRSFDGKLESGQLLGNGSYQIIEYLGAGGQASTYLAQSVKTEPAEQLPLQVVLKEFILPAHAGAEQSLNCLAQIQCELELMQKLEHPNLPRYYDLFVEDHRCYLVLEYIEGKSLRQLLQNSGPLAEETILGLARQMCEILLHLHGQSPPVIHRDFTPDNLILDSKNTLKLIDFNLAQELDDKAASSCIVGKHAYLPPEQFRGRACIQSDIYALGASLYFLSTAEDPEPISSSHPILKNELISPELDFLIARATELELDKRYSCVQELLAALDEMLNGS